MCDDNSNQNCCCEQPEKLETKPEECTEEKIRECHGDTKHHPCSENKKNNEQ